MRKGGLVLFALALAVPGSSQDVFKEVGSATLSADTTAAHPGGLVIVRLQSRRPLGAAFAILDGHRAPFYPSPRGPRALVPVPVTARPGPATLGVEVIVRRGRQRVPLEIEIAPRDYPPRTVVIPEWKRSLLKQPSVVRDSRQLLGLVRAETPSGVPLSSLRAPVTIVPGEGFGSEQSWIGGSPVESMMDSVYGEYHRGLDYEVPLGTVVMAPAAATVAHAGPTALGGQTLVLDHGQGVVSVLFHLQRIDPKVGDRVASRDPVGLSGDTGLAVTPQVQWRTYVHGVAVDPRSLERLD